jgi:hypothetical protein
MPEKETMKRARKDKRQGKAPSTQAGEFVREEMHHIREGKHGARSPQQAIAIGLSKARRAGVDMPPPRRGSAETKAKAERDEEVGQSGGHRKPSRTRSRATSRALKKEPRASASRKSLARQGHQAAMRRGKADRSRAAKKAARTRKSTQSRTRRSRAT